MTSSMELLVQNRRNCDVLDENPYMFGRPQTHNHFRGSDIIREMAQNCGAKHPAALSSTKLRKHMATMSKVLNLKDNEMDNLADFLGHDISRVHRQYYRLPERTLQLAKISIKCCWRWKEDSFPTSKEKIWMRSALIHKVNWCELLVKI